MLVRFLTATVLAAATAAVLAGAEPRAQSPREQKPAAATGEKPRKAPKPWPLDADAYRARRLEAEALPLFASQDPIDIVISADFKAVQKDRDVDSKKLHPGTLAIVADGKPGTPISIQLRTRGHVRRNARLCEFAPLHLEFPKDGVKGTIFDGQGNIKLGTHCQSEGVYQQYVLKEYMANRLLNVLTPRSLRVRLARITYADTDTGKKPFTRPGVFYEEVGDLAKRMESRELPVPRQIFQSLDQPALLFTSLFQYMIGNVDYSILKLHNVIMLDDAKGVRSTVPYDFDYSGLVNAHYAVPAKELNLASVQQRMYRGPCKTEAEVTQALQPFRDKQGDLLALPASLVAVGLDDGQRRSTEKYLNEFFDLIGRPDKVKKVFVTDCNPISGMRP
jgi:hypothetical protein